MPILGFLKAQESACSLIDLMNFCEQDLTLLIDKDLDYQIAIFQKNFLKKFLISPK